MSGWCVEWMSRSDRVPVVACPAPTVLLEPRPIRWEGGGGVREGGREGREEGGGGVREEGWGGGRKEGRGGG